MVRTGHEQRPVLIPHAVDFAVGEDVVPAVPALRRIDRFLEVLVDGDSAARTIIETVAALDEDGISPQLSLVFSDWLTRPVPKNFPSCSCTSQ